MDREYVRTQAITFVVSVFTRPEMYTLQGSFNEAYAFLHGWYGGQASADHESEGATIWFEIGEHLRIRYGVDTVRAFASFRDEFPTSAAACRAMAQHVSALFGFA